MLKFMTGFFILQIQDSLLPSSVAISLPLCVCTGTSRGRKGVYNEVHTILQMPMGQLGRPSVEASHWYVDRSPDGVCNHILLIPSTPYLLFFLLFPESQSHDSDQYSGCYEKYMDFCSCIPNSWKNQALTYGFYIFLWEKS